MQERKKYIKNHKNLDSNHPRILQQNQIIIRNNDYYPKYKKIENLEIRIIKLRQTNQPADQCANCKRFNTD